MLVVSLALSMLAMGALPQAASAFDALAWRTALHKQINHYRANHGLAKLRWNTDLQQAATAHSADMARYHTLSHTSLSTGSSWLSRIRWYGYMGDWVGENLAMGQWTPRQTLRAWIRSDAHRANLLNRHYRVTGIGVVKGSYSGHWTLYITADFGGP